MSLVERSPIEHRTTLANRGGRSALGAWSYFLLLGISFLLGCRGGTDTNSEMHVGHFLPPHRPTNLDVAIERMDALCQLIATNGRIPDWREIARQDPHVSPTDLESLPTTAWEELRDIVGWLPDLVIDSDLPEDAWNTVSEQSKAMLDLLDSSPNPVANRGADDLAKIQESWNRSLQVLQAPREQWRKLHVVAVIDEPPQEER